MSHKQFYSRVSDRKNHHFVSVLDDGYIEASELEAFFKHTLHKLGMKVRDPRVRTVNDERIVSCWPNEVLNYSLYFF